MYAGIKRNWGRIKPTGAVVDFGHPLSKGLVCASTMYEGGGQSIRSIVRDRIGTFTGGTLWSRGMIGGPCISLDGSGDYVDYGVDPAYADFSGIFTVSIWIKPTLSDATDREIASVGGLASNWKWIILKWNGATSDILFAVSNSGGSAIAQPITSGVSVNNGNWHHIVCTSAYNGTTVSAEIFINGISRATASGTGTPGSGGTNPLRLGFATFVNRSDFSGLLDNFMLWNRTLKSQEITQLYREPFCMFRPFGRIGYDQAAVAGGDVYSGRGIGRGISRGVYR